MVVIAPEKPITIETEPEWTEPKPSEIGEILRQAALEIVERGWTQERDVDRETGRVCMLGALAFAVGATYAPDGFLTFAAPSFSSPRYSAARHYIESNGSRYIENVGWRPVTSIPAYNDEPHRTREDVLTLLKSLADLADAEGARPW